MLSDTKGRYGVDTQFKHGALALVLSCLTGVGMPAAAQSSDAMKPLRIGLVGPFSGGSSDFGNSTRFGAELAISEINEGRTTRSAGILVHPYAFVRYRAPQSHASRHSQGCPILPMHAGIFE